MSKYKSLKYDKISDLGKLFESLNSKKAFVIMGSKTQKNNIEKLEPNIDFEHVIFENFHPNPSFDTLTTSVEIFLEENCDIIIAIGGGTAIDLAKMTSIFSSNEGSIQEYLDGILTFRNKGCKVVAIPTTSGSGSESTHFAVLYNGITKYSVASPFMLPDFVILDPTLTYSMPRRLTAVTGMDALCQGIESFWSNKSTSFSESYSIKAIELCFDNLEESVNFSNIEARNNMHLAANYAGRAIDIAKTTASHAISYPLTKTFGIPHGHAVALTMPEMIMLNFNVSIKNINYSNGLSSFNDKIESFLDYFNFPDIQAFSNKITNLMKSMGLETSFKDLEINLSEKDISNILENVNQQRLDNNPRNLSEEDIFQMLKQIS